MKQADLFGDVTVGAGLKKAGIAQVLDHNDEWKDSAKAMLLSYIAQHGPCPIENARAWALRNGLRRPGHPNAWGAVTNALACSGQIRRTGEWQPAQSAKSHASMYPLWVATK